MGDTIYQAKDFEDWYQYHYKTKYDRNNTWTQGDIDDYDWQLGQKLYNLYQQGQYYQGEHDRAAADSAQRATDAKIAADVSRQRLEKYLPQQLALQGLYGTGMSEDAYLKLQNQYQGAVSDANKQHEANLAAYKSTLDAQKLALGTQAGEAVQGIIDQKKVDDENARIEEERKAEILKADQERYFNEAYSGLNSGNFTTIDEVNAYITPFENMVSETQWMQLEALANGVKADIKEFNEQKAKELRDKYTPMDEDLSVLVVGRKEVTETSVTEYAQYFPNNCMFLYNSKSYFKANGKIYKI